ncbi:MAG: DUF2924 domain-containing protein [Pirellulaceae bacterium]|jgi:hypothetical protein|nr:DUF2924 domain-containing protein [Planctomycetota bacterium]
MSLNVGKEVAALQRMTVKQLRERYAEVFGDETRTGNKAWLVKRIAWRLQAVAQGGLSERARQRAVELANEADIRMTPPKAKPVTTTSTERTVTSAVRFACDNRLPLPGTVLTREYKGDTLQLRVLEHGFEYEGEVYRSLSAVAKAITGSHTNGFHFFRLRKGGQR